MNGPPDGPDRDERFRRRLAEVEEREERRARRRRRLDLASLGIAPLIRRIAARRGAQAWDWRAGRHRLFGDPSREVRDRDEPR